MNKKFLKLVMFFCSFFISISVYAYDNKYCKYGTRVEDDASTWTEGITLYYKFDENKVDVDFGANNPLLHGITFSDRCGSCIDNPSYNQPNRGCCDYMKFDLYRSVSGADNASLYITDTVPTDGTCPKYLHYEYYDITISPDMGSPFDTEIIMIYSDDSDKEGNLRVKLPIYNESTIANITNTGVSSEINTQQKYILIHEDEKNTKESELIGEGDCLSYSTRMLRIKNSVPEGSTCDSNPAFDNAFSDLESMCNEYRNSEIYVSSDGTTTDCGKLCSVMYDEVSDYCKERDESRGNSKYCGSLGNRIVNWIFKIIRYIRYGLPPVAIILSILDYIKAISSENDDDIKKTNGKVIKRLIAVALLFVIPFIISFILGLFDIPGLDASNPFCAK